MREAAARRVNSRLICAGPVDPLSSFAPQSPYIQSLARAQLKLQLFRALLRAPAFRGKARLEGILCRALFCNPTIDLPNGVRILIDPLEWAQRDLLRDAEIEPLTIGLMRRLLAPSQIYVDVGCHIGYHTLVARRCVGPGGRVIAIDPQPYNCERTLANWRANGFSNLVVYVGAAGSSVGSVKCAHQPATDRARLSLQERPADSDAPRFRVAVHTLKEVFQMESIDRAKLLKIDVEGFEQEVLKGLGGAVSRVDNIIVELLPGNIAGSAELLRIFQDDPQWLLRTVQGQDWRLHERLPENNLWIARKNPAAQWT